MTDWQQRLIAATVCRWFGHKWGRRLSGGQVCMRCSAYRQEWPPS